MILKNKYNIYISHELIYQYLAFNKDQGGRLYELLPHRGKKYKKRNIQTRKRIWNEAKRRKSIDDRPPVVNEKSEFGHWEGDTVESKGHQGGIGTFSEVTEEDLLRVQNLINERPRKSLNYKTPKEVLYEELLSRNTFVNIMKSVS